MIPFNRTDFGPLEERYLAEAMKQGHSSGSGPFSERAETLLAARHGSPVLLTSSGTHALELAARLLNLRPGDEVIVPAYTFVTTASAFMWNGARPVFADVRPDTLNLDPESVESLISSRTKAICIVHYAGVPAEPQRYLDLAQRYGLDLIEDNAHGLGSYVGNRPLGTFGSLGTLSFHETKNASCGEGGALIVNDEHLLRRAVRLRDKGTNRGAFIAGQVDKYTWTDDGSSWVLSDLLAAVLVGQLERFDEIQARRHAIWDRYATALQGWAAKLKIETPAIPVGIQHSAHMYFLRMQSRMMRDDFIRHMAEEGVAVVFHYQALHESPRAASLKLRHGDVVNSRSASEGVVRLPLYPSLSTEDQDKVIDAVLSFDF